MLREGIFPNKSSRAMGNLSICLFSTVHKYANLGCIHSSKLSHSNRPQGRNFSNISLSLTTITRPIFFFLSVYIKTLLDYIAWVRAPLKKWQSTRYFPRNIWLTECNYVSETEENWFLLLRQINCKGHVFCDSFRAFFKQRFYWGLEVYQMRI